MPEVWQNAVIERLRNALHPDGGWGYGARTTPNAEPTALAALALAAQGACPEERRRALEWLARVQLEDGGVPICPELPSPCWATPLGMLAWLRAPDAAVPQYASQIKRAVGWLMRNHGKPMEADPKMFGHDPQIVGWGWARDTHSWVEPTAYAVLAMKAGGDALNHRTHEGIRLLIDRAIPDGGWNYGNTRVLGHMLRPFPAQTGIALLALSGGGSNTRVLAAIEYLHKELPRIRAPMSLAWGVMGLRSWKALPAAAETWLAEAAAKQASRPAAPHLDALLLLASAEHCPLVTVTEGTHNG